MTSADAGRGADGRPTDEELYDVLCRTRRRHVLQHLRRRGERESLTKLVEAVAAREYGKPPDEITHTEQRRIYVSLCQTHLPKLDQQELIDWDREENTIELGGNVRLEEYFPREAWTVDRWDRYYLTVAAVGSLVTVFAAANLWVFDAVEPATTGAAVVGGALLVAIVHGTAERA